MKPNLSTYSSWMMWQEWWIESLKTRSIGFRLSWPSISASPFLGGEASSNMGHCSESPRSSSWNEKHEPASIQARDIVTGPRGPSDSTDIGLFLSYTTTQSPSVSVYTDGLGSADRGWSAFVGHLQAQWFHETGDVFHRTIAPKACVEKRWGSFLFYTKWYWINYKSTLECRLESFEGVDRMITSKNWHEDAVYVRRLLWSTDRSTPGARLIVSVVNFITS